MKKKLMAGLLALCMVISMLPLTAFADDPAPAAAPEVKGFGFVWNGNQVNITSDKNKNDLIQGAKFGTDWMGQTMYVVVNAAQQTNLWFQITVKSTGEGTETTEVWGCAADGSGKDTTYAFSFLNRVDNPLQWEQQPRQSGAANYSSGLKAGDKFVLKVFAPSEEVTKDNYATIELGTPIFTSAEQTIPAAGNENNGFLKVPVYTKGDVAAANLTAVAGKDGPAFGHAEDYKAELDPSSNTITITATNLQVTENSDHQNGYWVGLALAQPAAAAGKAGDGDANKVKYAWAIGERPATVTYQATDSTQPIGGKNYDTIYKGWGSPLGLQNAKNKDSWLFVQYPDGSVSEYKVKFNLSAKMDVVEAPAGVAAPWTTAPVISEAKWGEGDDINKATLKLKVEGLEKHASTNQGVSAGYWVGIGIPRAHEDSGNPSDKGSYASYKQYWSNSSAEDKAKTTSADNYMTKNNMTYATFYFNLTPAQLAAGAKGVVEVGTTTYTIDFSESTLKLEDKTVTLARPNMVEHPTYDVDSYANGPWQSVTLTAAQDKDAVNVNIKVIKLGQEAGKNNDATGNPQTTDPDYTIGIAIPKAVGDTTAQVGTSVGDAAKQYKIGWGSIAAEAEYRAPHGYQGKKADVNKADYATFYMTLTQERLGQTFVIVAGKGENAVTYKVTFTGSTLAPAPAGDFGAVPAGGKPWETSTKTAADLQDSLTITKTADHQYKVTGQLKYVESWQDFNPSVEREQSGYYMAFYIPKTMDGKTITEMQLPGSDTNGNPIWKVYKNTPGTGEFSLSGAFTDKSNAELDAADCCYLVVHLSDTKTTYTMKLKYGDEGDAQEYTFDYSELKPLTLTAADFTFLAPTGLKAKANGTAITMPAVDTIITKTTATEGTVGAITMKFAKVGSEDTPAATITEAGEYQLYIDVARTSDYKSATGLTKDTWTFTVAEVDAPEVAGSGYVGTIADFDGTAVTNLGGTKGADWVDQTLYVVLKEELAAGKYLWFDVKVTKDGDTKAWGIASVGDGTHKTFACSFLYQGQWEKVPTGAAALTGGETVALKVYVTAEQLTTENYESKEATLGSPIWDVTFTVPENGGNVTAQKPAAITDLRATAGNGQVTLNWTAPADNGAAITEYHVYFAAEGNAFNTYMTVTENKATIDHLTNGTKYGFIVKAVNTVGESDASNTAEATPTSGNGGTNPGNTGGGGGSFIPSNPVTPVAPTDPTVDVTPTVSNGSATATVPADALNAAENSENVTVNVNTNADVDSVTATIPASAVAGLAEGTDASLTVSTPVADVVIPNETLAALGGQSGTVSVSVSEADNGEITVDIQKNGTSVGELPAAIKVSVPVSEEAAEAGTGLVAVLVDEDGNETILPKSVLDDGEMSVLLETGSATVKFVDNAKDFDDVKTDWYADAVAFVSSRNLFKGTTETTFEPNTYTSRAMMVTVLHRLEREPEASGISFADVPASAYYAEAASWATDMGITTGTGAGFEGDANITREMMVTMLYRYAQKLAPNAGKMGSFANMVGADEVSSWATEAMNWAVGSGLIEGDANGLRPNGTSTRAEMATVLMRFVKLITE